MIYKLTFGDSSGDGHGVYIDTWASCPDKKCFEKAKEKIKNKYGQKFFEGFAHEYQEPFLSEAVCEALHEAGYPIARFFEMSDYDWQAQYPEIETMLDLSESDIDVWIDQVVDMYIFLLNAHGACLTQIGTPFESLEVDFVGYGCFD